MATVYRRRMRIDRPGSVEPLHAGRRRRGKCVALVHEILPAPASCQSQHNLDASIESFARSCFEYALEIGRTCGFSTKDYDLEIWIPLQGHLRRHLSMPSTARFEQAGIEYFYTLIDDAVARVMKSEGGFHLGLQELRR